ncbi:MAG TPA: ABC transporter permease [Candidatus Acidoferrales bacterium]|nr:ABC transporter permease [Candidatus Acidoferrales bacterium]
MNTFLQDVRYALRMLAKSPGFLGIAILTLALGIGANTALFSVVNGVLLNPLPYPQPDRLVALYSRTSTFSESSISYPNFLDWQRSNRSLAAMAAYRSENFNLTGAGEPERVRGEMVSADFFSILGVSPVIGRGFTAQDDRPGGAPVVLLSEGFWKQKFGGSQQILGQSISLNGTPYTVVGVIPANFFFMGSNFRLSDAYSPIGQWTDPTFLDRRVGMGMDAVARLKPGFTLTQARSDLAAVAQVLSKEYPDADKDSGIVAIPLKQDMVGDVAPLLYVLLGAVGFVLLIACVNIANLLLARSTGRTREFAIRAAMGASRSRVVRQLLTEGVLLSVTGGVLGLLLAAWGTRVAIRMLPQALPRSGQVGLDTHVLIFTLALSLLAGILFGLAPALKAFQTNLQDTLREGGRGSSGRRHRLQSIFVVTETALALILLVGAGLMIRSLVALWDVNPGFNPHNLLSFGIAYPPEMQKATPDQLRSHALQLDAALAAVPGIESVSVVGGSLPMQGDSELPFWLEGQPKPSSDSDMNWALFYLGGPGYLDAMQTPMLRGRFINPQDTLHSPPVIVIDENFARKFFPGQDPLGKRVNLGILGVQAQIVGVAGHVKHWGLDSDAHNVIQAQFYFPMLQVPDKFMPLLAKGSDYVVRTRVPPDTLIPSIKHAVEQVNSQQVVYKFETMEETIDRSLAARRFAMDLLDVFAALALVLACIGIYGVISYLVGQRTNEIGIRIALGAQRGDVLRLIIGEGARMALIGVALGIAAGLTLTRLMSDQLFGVSPHDPLTFAGVAVVLAFVAIAACYIPARRAMRVDPMVALRYE